MQINSEYCWTHSGPGLGGWTCQHPECRSQIRSGQRVQIAGLPDLYQAHGWPENGTTGVVGEVDFECEDAWVAFDAPAEGGQWMRWEYLQVL
jgi:hypothetical protein